MKKINLSSFSDTEEKIAVSEELLNPPKSCAVELHQAFTDIWGKSFEKVESIDLNLIHHFQDSSGCSQPFIINEEKVSQIVASASDIGIITPLIVRELHSSCSESQTRNFQIIAGHHRYEAAKLLNLLSVPCVVRKLTDEEAFQVVAESNIQRDRTLPSEYGRIFTVYMIKRSDTEMTAKEIANKFSVSPKTMYRYINVAKLDSRLQAFFDSGKIHINAADILCNFSKENQDMLVKLITEADDCPKITVALAKKFAEIIEHYGDDTVPFYEFSGVIAKPLKPKYKSEVYNTVCSRYNVHKSEQEMDELTQRLLSEYFEAHTVRNNVKKH